MFKNEAREIFSKKRNEISYTEQLKWDDLILIWFQTLQLPFLNCVMSFYPIEEKKEINTLLLTDYLHFKNPALEICYPKTDLVHNTMHAIACHADSIFEPNSWGIPEPLDTEIVQPVKIDLVIVPLLICDLAGHRVGYGKGFYDRFLKECRDDCIKVGVSYFAPVEQIEDAADFDVPLDFCITPQRAYVF